MNAFPADPLFAPMTTNESNQSSSVPMTTDATTKPAAIPFLIHRAFDVRSVHNSIREIRLSMDVPGVTQREDIAVCLQRRQSDGNNPDSSSVNIRGSLNNGESFFSKTLELPTSKELDLANVQAKLTNGVLEIIAPKKATNQHHHRQPAAGDYHTNIPVV